MSDSSVKCITIEYYTRDTILITFIFLNIYIHKNLHLKRITSLLRSKHTYIYLKIDTENYL